MGVDRLRKLGFRVDPCPWTLKSMTRSGLMLSRKFRLASIVVASGLLSTWLNAADETRDVIPLCTIYAVDEALIPAREAGQLVSMDVKETAQVTENQVL